MAIETIYEAALNPLGDSMIGFKEKGDRGREFWPRAGANLVLGNHMPGCLGDQLHPRRQAELGVNVRQVSLHGAR
jgi:hypothetical protein